MIGILLSAALLPAVLLWIYVWRMDPQKEPGKQLMRAVWYGVGICFPVALFEQVVQTMLFGQGGHPTTLFDTTATAFLVAAIPEESFKLLALWLVLRHNPYFDEHFDGIVYAVCVGLGFAAMENIGYIVGSGDQWASVAIARSLLAVPGHYAFAVMMGYYYSLYHFANRSAKIRACILLVPVVAHGVYDALALSGTINTTVGGISFFVLIYFCIKMHKFAYKRMQEQIKRDITPFTTD